MSTYFSYLYSLIIITGLEISLIRPEFFGWAAITTLFFNILFIWLAVRAKFNINFWNFLISPFLFLLGGLLFLGFSDSWLIKELVIIFLVVANTIFLYRLITFSYHKYKYKKHSLSNISRIINLSSIFFWFTVLFDLGAFLKVPAWLLLIVGYLITYLIIYQFFSISKIKFSVSRLFILISSILLLELFYVISWLPLVSATRAILIASAYYFITGLSRHHIQASLAKSVYLRYSLIAGLIWVLVLITARWE